MRFDVLSLFPSYFSGPFSVSIIRRAIDRGLVEINVVDIRKFSGCSSGRVDDRPYGGGPGMVMRAEPVIKSIRSVKSQDSRVIYLTPQGSRLDGSHCARLAKCPHLIILCGSYEGIDSRVSSEVDEEISVCDCVLTNGAPAAVVLVDATIRFVPGVIGNSDSVMKTDTFSPGMCGGFGPPLYTRPPRMDEGDVPEVLLSGDHGKIDSWRRKVAYKKTAEVRPDLINRRGM